MGAHVRVHNQLAQGRDARVATEDGQRRRLRNHRGSLQRRVGHETQLAGLYARQSTLPTPSSTGRGPLSLGKEGGTRELPHLPPV